MWIKYNYLVLLKCLHQGGKQKKVLRDPYHHEKALHQHVEIKMKTLTKLETRVIFLVDYSGSIFLLILGSHLRSPGVKRSNRMSLLLLSTPMEPQREQKGKPDVSIHESSFQKRALQNLFSPSNMYMITCLYSKKASWQG